MTDQAVQVIITVVVGQEKQELHKGLHCKKVFQLDKNRKL